MESTTPTRSLMNLGEIPIKGRPNSSLYSGSILYVFTAPARSAVRVTSLVPLARKVVTTSFQVCMGAPLIVKILSPTSRPAL